MYRPINSPFLEEIGLMLPSSFHLPLTRAWFSCLEKDRVGCALTKQSEPEAIRNTCLFTKSEPSFLCLED